MSGGGPPDRLRIEHIDRSPAEASIIRLHGELDLVTAPLLREELERYERPLVLDLSQVEFLDSTGLVLLMEVAREPAANGWSLALRRDLSPPVARLFQVTRTEGLFAWVD